MIDTIAPMVVFITLILTSGGVILLRPLSKRLAELLHVMTQERLNATRQGDVAQLRDLLSSLEHRLAQLEERQSFTESLLDASRLQNGRSTAALPEESRDRLGESGLPPYRPR